MARLWLPEGLYLQELCECGRPLDSGGTLEVHEPPRPLALRSFRPRERTLFVTCREAETHPRGLIVDRAFHAPGPGRAALSQVLDRSGQYVLRCGDYAVERLSVFQNLDVLTRAGQFMSAAMQLLHFEVPRAQSRNLGPLKELLRWWRCPDQRLDDRTDWQDVEPWIRREFDERDRCIDDARRAGRCGASLEAAVAAPACYVNLERELRFARELAQATWPTARRSERVGGATTTSAEAVDDAIGDCILSAFRNAAEWSQRSIHGSPATPNWFGFPLAHTKNLVKRAFAAVQGRAKSTQLPLKEARELNQALASPWSNCTLENAVSTYVSGCYDDPVPEVHRRIDRYFDAKRRFAVANFYLALRGLRAALHDSPTPDERRRALLGLSRAIDASVWPTGPSTRDLPRNQAGDFVHLAEQFIREHLRVEAPDPKHRWDQALLDALQLAYPSETNRDPPVASDPSAPPRCDPLRTVEIADSLAALIVAAALSPTERQAILHKYGVVMIAPDLSEAELKRVQRRAFDKLRAASRRREFDEPLS